jgi:hypothetical protein
MDCREVKNGLADLSAEALPSVTCEELRRHLQECPPCAREWENLQHTLFTVSTTPQQLLSAEQSRLMWARCARHIEDKIERERLAAQRPAWWQWSRSPAMGWASLGGALAVLAGVWLLAPSTPQNSATQPLLANTDEPRAEWIRFNTPPRVASKFINHHTAMAFDPFSDHVGVTLVSDSATEIGTSPELQSR